MKTIMATEAKQLMTNKLLRLGMGETDAKTLSDCLAEASLNGIDTHGMRLLPCYLLELEHGRAKPKPNMTFERQTPVSSVLDADAANGVVAGMFAMQHAIDKAKAIGLSMVVVKNSNHFGAASNFTRLAARQQCIGLSMTNSDALVALQGGTEPFLGTNPIALSVPGRGDNQFDLDFATSQVSYSKVKAYLAGQQPLQSGWAIDSEGNDSAENNLMQALQPLGGYKGQGLGMMVQMLTCVLAGMPRDNELTHLYCEPYDAPRQVSHMFLAINPEIFMDYDEFTQRVADLMQAAQEHTPDAILAGKKELGITRQRLVDGIPLSDSEFAFFEGLRAEEAA